MILSLKLCIGAVLLGIVVYHGFTDANGFLWFEMIPNPDDPCIITVTDSQPMAWKDIHPDPSCTYGGLLWYGTFGGVHLHIFQDLQKKEEFKLCLTGGEAHTVAVSYDYMGKHWTPIAFPTYLGDVEDKWRCKRSLNGTMDLYVRGMHKSYYYFGFFTWEIEPSELDQTHFQPDHSKKKKANKTESDNKEAENK